MTNHAITKLSELQAHANLQTFKDLFGEGAHEIYGSFILTNRDLLGIYPFLTTKCRNALSEYLVTDNHIDPRTGRIIEATLAQQYI